MMLVCIITFWDCLHTKKSSLTLTFYLWSKKNNNLILRKLVEISILEWHAALYCELLVSLFFDLHLHIRVKEVTDTGGCGLSCRTHTPLRRGGGKMLLQKKPVWVMLFNRPIVHSPVIPLCDVKELISLYNPICMKSTQCTQTLKIIFSAWIWGLSFSFLLYLGSDWTDKSLLNTFPSLWNAENI